MTHNELINISYRFMLSKFSCGIAFKEMKTISSECADVIGFGGHQHSVLFEIKVSRSDFLTDKKKTFRKYPERGIGRYRFYVCPEGMIKISDLPNGWGLIWFINGKLQMQINPFCRNPIMYSCHQNRHENINQQAERDILYSALRRNFKNLRL